MIVNNESPQDINLQILTLAKTVKIKSTFKRT